LIRKFFRIVFGGFFIVLFALNAWGDQIVTATLHEEPKAEQPQKSMWCVGLGIAAEYTDLQAKQKDDFAPLGTVEFSNREQTTKHFQVAPSLEIGRTLLEDFYVGLLFSWHLVNTDTGNQRSSFRTNYSLNHKFRLLHYFDILLKIGYFITPSTLIYALVGPSIARWSHTTMQNVEFGGNAFQPIDDIFRMTRTSVGLGLGLGIAYAATQNWIISLDYIHHFYKAATASQIMSVTENIGGMIVPRPPGTVSKKISPSHATIALRVTYNFCC